MELRCMSAATSVGVAVSALQNINLFGIWRQPILVLSWTDVKYFNFTWRYLCALGIDALSGEGGTRTDGVHQRELHRCACVREEWSPMHGLVRIGVRRHCYP
jgi:hypothetical protein